MGLKRPGFEFRVELAGKKPWVVLNLHNLDKILVGRDSGNHKTVPSQDLLEGSIELVAVTVSFRNHRGVIDAVSARTVCEVRRVRTEPHCSTDGVHAEQIAKFVDHGMRCVLFELGAVGFREATNISGILNNGTLHTQANPEIRHSLLTCILNGPDHAG